MAIDIQKELEKKLKEGSQREMGLTDRLNYLDNYNKDVAVPQISSEGPKGYNPINSLNALFQMISGRKGVSQDLSTQSSNNIDILSSLANYEKQNAPDKIDPLKLLELQIKAKEAGMNFNPATMGLDTETTVSKEKQQLISDIDEVLGRDVGALVGFPNLFKIGENITTKAKIEQIKGKLGLDARKALKGSGQISDYEMKILEKSVGALNYSMSNKDFVAELQKIKGILSGDYAQDDKVGGFTIKEVK